MLKINQRIEDKKERLEKSLYNWLDSTDKVQEDILNLIDKNNVSKSTIAKNIDTMKNKLRNMENILKEY